VWERLCHGEADVEAGPDVDNLFCLNQNIAPG
jgi:hypothetical protein